MVRSLTTALAVLFLLLAVPTAAAAGSGGSAGAGPWTWAPMAVAMLAFAGGLAPTIALRHPTTVRSPGPYASRAALKVAPRTPPSLGLMAAGIQRLHGGRPGTAVTALKEAACRRPRDPAAHYAYGVALVLAGRGPQGLEQIAYAIRLDDVLLAVMVQDPLLIKAGVLHRGDVHRFLQRMARWYAHRINPSYA